ncbi:MAG: hypothetical protein NWT08_04255 [Akkermansiaceae bacterium]|nr:hypothetical protein [Akkermansiaceae bacterium]MDP4646090.1 hypothetical protein [Akkermansiaceae bacterium]MDP4720889.1 hypothetical protein [Akkermansiaceae bacterium]MDP4780752.1 hypothetical protein [Akkermansiaceae bacterium]MDP4898161.1 hypothetical protein [Akkermansiaceae bacterium]
MIPEPSPLIDAATKPFADNAEQRLAAIAILDEKADSYHPDAGVAIARWSILDAKKYPHLWIGILYVLAGVSLLVSNHSAKKVSDIFREIRVSSSLYHTSTQFPSTHFTAGELLLLGDPSLSAFKQKEALYLSAPENPAYYSEFAYQYAEMRGVLPPDYLDTASSIDPENSFFPYIAAGRIGKEAVSKVSSAYGRSSNPERMRDGVALRPIPDETEWEIADVTAFTEAMDLISQAAALDRLDSYETMMMEERLKLFPKNTALEKLRALTYSAMQTSQVISLLKVADVICTSAYLHSVEGDEEGFRRDFALSEAFLKQISKSPKSTLVGEMVYNANADSLTRTMLHGAARLGLEDLAELLDARSARFQELKDLRVIRGKNSDDIIDRRGSVLHAFTTPTGLRSVPDPPVINDLLLTPGRLADYDFVSLIFVWMLLLLLFLSAMSVLFFRLRASAVIEKLARRLSGLFSARDWVWIIGLGVIAPFAFIYAVSWLTPMGGRSRGLSSMGFIFPAIHFMILLLLILSVPPLIIRWRMRKRLGAFGIAEHVPHWRCLFPIIGITIALTTFPLLGNQLLSEPLYFSLAPILGLWGLSILISAFIALLGKKDHCLRNSISARLLLPVFSSAIIIAAISVPIIYASAERWSAKDKLSYVVPQGFNFIEAKIADLKRKEVNAVLGFQN